VKKEIGKILSIDFGFGGYQDAMLGFSVVLGRSSGWQTLDFRGFFGRPDAAELFSEIAQWAGKLLTDAEKKKLSSLVGVPVEVTFDGNALHSWRILTEAL